MAANNVSDLVLSSIHIGSNAAANTGTSTVISKFYYTLPPSSSVLLPPLTFDEDGDLEVPRLKHELILLEHTMATPIERVGTQVWSASLLMSDFILYNKEIFKNGVVLELGSGCGLVGITAARYAKRVFCTDIKNEGAAILEQCHRNVIRNNVQDTVTVHELNWFNNDELLLGQEEKFTWQSHDVHMLTDTSIILACDIIYDNELTDAFFNTLINVSMRNITSRPIILIALEKRINFTLDDLAPSSPCYDYFISCLNKRYITNDGKTALCFDSKCLPISFPQSFNYDRNQQLEIWELKIKDI